MRVFVCTRNSDPFQFTIDLRAKKLRSNANLFLKEKLGDIREPECAENAIFQNWVISLEGISDHNSVFAISRDVLHVIINLTLQEVVYHVNERFSCLSRVSRI